MQLDFDFEKAAPETSVFAIPGSTQEIPSKQKIETIPAHGFHFEPRVDGTVADYSAFPANRMYIANDKTILTAERPQWVPPLNYDYVCRNCHIPPVCKIRENYILSTGQDDPQYYKLSLAGFAATIDYYVKYGKALNRQEAIDKNNRLLEEAKDILNNDKSLTPDSYSYRYYKSIIDGNHKIKPQSIRLLSDKSMTRTQSQLFKKNGLNEEGKWTAWHEIRKSLEQKMIDMSCQFEDLESSYTKGAETSYGDKNTSTTLFQELGILVKRQNGDAINQEEIKEIKVAFDKIRPVFGNLKTICAEYGLKVSHSGIKNMHARKAIGIFYDAYKAIGVKFGDSVMNHLVLAHELSHFLDCRAGKEHGHFFSSDKPDSIENQIAVSFRTEMNQDKKSTGNSKYLQRTCECFARAMEQFTAFIVSPVQYLVLCKNEAYAPDDVFREKITPLVEKLIQERQALWHKDELNIENKPGVFETLQAEAAIQTADFQGTMNIHGMSNTVLESMANIGCKQREWYKETIERYKSMEILTLNTLEILKQSMRLEHLNIAFEKEYKERLKDPNSGLFPIYPKDITVERFKDNFQTVMKSSFYTNSSLIVAKMLIEKALPQNREAINEFLKKEGCINAEAMQKLLHSWTEKEKTKKQTRRKDEPAIGIAS
jgi:hypothetical protein